MVNTHCDTIDELYKEVKEQFSDTRWVKSIELKDDVLIVRLMNSIDFLFTKQGADAKGETLFYMMFMEFGRMVDSDTVTTNEVYVNISRAWQVCGLPRPQEFPDLPQQEQE